MKLYLSFLVFLFLASVLPLSAQAQVPSKSECITTAKARSLSLSTEQATKLCEKNSIEVVNCAVTQMQSSSSTNMEKVLKQCTMEWTEIPGIVTTKPPEK
jgi:hypothetical protein